MLTLESLVLFSEDVLHGHLDIFKSDICGTTAPDTLAVHPSGADTTTFSLNQKQTETVHTRPAGANRSSEVIAPVTIGNPLLLSVDNVVLAIRSKLSLAPKAGNITTSIRLSNGKTDTLVTGQNPRQDPINKSLLTEFDQRRASDTITTEQVPDQTTAARARQLVGQEHLVEVIPALWGHGLDSVWGMVDGVLDTKQASQVAAFTHLLVDLVGHFLVLVPFGDIGFDFGLDPFADFSAEGFVGLVEVGRVVLQHISSRPIQTYQTQNLHHGTKQDPQTAQDHHTDHAAAKAQTKPQPSKQQAQEQA